GELAIGGLAALAWSAYGQRLRTVTLDVAGSIAALVLGAVWLKVSLDDTALWRGGIIGHALLSATLIVAAIGGGLLPRLLSFRPLRELGRISYGVYAIHFPLFLLLTQDRIGVAGTRLFVVRFAATIALALLVHWFVEAPIRWGGALPGRQALLAMSTGMAAVLLLATGVTTVNHRT